jgi:diphosphomevalonate decarboxylase
VAPNRPGPLAATFEAPPNIALVKYWGVRDPSLGLPYNSSLSVTLDRFRSRTTVRFREPLTGDRFVLNGAVQDGNPLRAVVELLDRIRAAARRTEHAQVRSSNNVPTASGLASSASGFAALAGAGAAAAGLLWSPRRLSQLARYGSGSACRSFFGGFVEWQAGSSPDGSDCFARPRFPEAHWPELVDYVTLLEDAPTKEVRSAVAMQRSVTTSPGFRRRVEAVPARLEGMVRAIRRRDGPALFQLVMEECDDFRSVCETTVPKLDYLTRTSRRVLDVVRELNRSAGESRIGYTHDAGAHLHLFLLEEDLPTLRGALRKVPGIARQLVLRPGPGGRLMGPTAP